MCVCVCVQYHCVSDHSLTHPGSLFVSSVLGNSCSFWTGTQAGLRWLTCKGVSFQSLSCLTVVLTGTVILFCLAERFYPKGMPSSLPLLVFSCSAEGWCSPARQKDFIPEACPPHCHCQCSAQNKDFILEACHCHCHCQCFPAWHKDFILRACHPHCHCQCFPAWHKDLILRACHPHCHCVFLLGRKTIPKAASFTCLGQCGPVLIICCPLHHLVSPSSLFCSCCVQLTSYIKLIVCLYHPLHSRMFFCILQTFTYVRSCESN